MLAYLKGIVEARFVDRIILDNKGVGYEIFMPMTDIGAIENLNLKNDIKILIHMQVKEDGILLFGFLEEKSKMLFQQLINVNKVGPKLALAIMSIFSVDEIVALILNDEAKVLAKTPGIGLKTAQKIIIELKDRLKNWQVNTSGDIDISSLSSNNEEYNDCLEALQILGYNEKQAIEAIELAIKSRTENEDLLQKALSFLGK